MQHTSIRRARTACAAALLLACTHLSSIAEYKIPWQSFTPDPARPIKRIALLDAVDLSKFAVMDTGGGSALFGMLGGAAKAGRLSQLAEKLKDGMGNQNVRVGDAVAASVERGLVEAGFEVVRVARRRGTPAKDGNPPIPADYSDIDADALLFIVVSVSGFKSSVNVTTEYMPFVAATASLESKSDRKALMLTNVSYCTPILKSDGPPVLPCADGVTALKSDEALTTAIDSGEAAKLLLGAAPVISSAITAQLKKAP